ncbi:30S ribosomal protein S8 [Piptocephalis cylindrospora]|uniref:30S ribosomal protein S8 n=1 Tax=Piptocephalis cylindrospora TaxID=1907219 RepID=A0A4P9Y282_9FUNG|nr:30S ribosomal protein S8 [Piptocephalis cylindrospora]|eukprot:RKP12978.1 30S ribosomal protein S8 [Piptocephalis cylindrospora]
MPRIYNLCSHIQNSFRWRLKSVCVPENKSNLAILRVLYNEGFLASISRGSHLGPDTTPTPTIPANIATRRYWIELKYAQNEPVLKKMSVVSKPTIRHHMTVHQLTRIVSGAKVGIVKPLQPGEIMIVSTNEGVMEAKEALRRRVGGELLCRISREG